MAKKPLEIFAVNFAALAREIAMDILPLHQILQLHQLDDEAWMRIQRNPQFQEQIASMSRDWQSASNVRERVKTKAATGLEAELEIYVQEIGDRSIPLIQRVEAGKFLARLGELDGARGDGSPGGTPFSITINIGEVQRRVEVSKPIKTIEAIPDGE